MTNVFWRGFSAVAAFALLACGPSVGAQTQPSDGPIPAPANGDVRVMTYNIQWLSNAEKPERIANIRSVINNINPSVITMQEIQDKQALRQFLNPAVWDLAIADVAREPQELAIAVKKPLRIIESGLVFTNPALDGGFPGARDVMRAVIQDTAGKQFTVYCVHFKSRSGGRMQTDWQRAMQASMLSAMIKGLYETEKNVVVAGDLNDAPDDVAPNILESGDIFAKGGVVEGKVLTNLTEPLADKDYVTIGLSYHYTGRAIAPIMAGSKADNARLRGMDYKFPDDVKVRETFFDQILASPQMAQSVTRAPMVYAGGDALRGRGGRISFNENDTVVYEELGDRASDHLPVYVDFRVR